MTCGNDAIPHHGLDAIRRHDIEFSLHRVLQLEFQADLKEIHARTQIDKQVEVTREPLFAAGERSKLQNVPAAVIPCNPQNCAAVPRQ